MLHRSYIFEKYLPVKPHLTEITSKETCLLPLTYTTRSTSNTSARLNIGKNSLFGSVLKPSYLFHLHWQDTYGL